MLESGGPNLNNNDLSPERLSEMMEKMKALNKTPVLDDMLPATKEQMLDVFPLTNDDRTAEDYVRYMKTFHGQNALTMAIHQTGKADSIMAEEQAKVAALKSKIEKDLTERRTDLLKSEELRVKMNKISAMIEERKKVLAYEIQAHPKLAARFLREQAELQSIEDEIDLVERRTVPGTSEILTDELIELAQRFSRLDEWFSEYNAHYN